MEQDAPLWAKALVGEFTALRDEFKALRGEFTVLRDEFTTFRDDMVGSVSKLSRDVASLDARVANVEADVKTMKKSISDLSESTMMTVSEVVADFVVNRRGDEVVGELGGDCQFAARAASDFFGARKLMRPSVRECVLFSPSGAAVAMSDRVISGTAPELHGVVKEGMKAYKLVEGSCVWEADEPDDRVDGERMGYKHYAATVTTLDKGEVVVDWGIGQFSKLPEDMRLYC